MSTKQSSPELTLPGSPSFEDRLQPWLNHAEYLIILTIVVMAWSAGWVDLLGFESDTNTILFGRYSLPYFAVIVAYSLGFVLWIGLMLSPRRLNRFRQAIGWLQARPLLMLAIWAGCAVAIWTMAGGRLGPISLSTWWASFRLLEAALLVLMVLFTLVIVLARPLPDVRVQRWRWVAMAVIGAIIAAELVLRGLALARVLPVQNLTGTTVPFGRIYQNEQGFGSGLTNSLGWYYPEPRLENGTRRIILTGDTFIQALQIAPENHMGVLLDSALAADPTQPPSEIIGQGQLGYGPTHFMNSRLLNYLWAQFEPDELVIFFHLVNDFQVTFDEPGAFSRVEIQADGRTEVVAEDFERWHLSADMTVIGHGASDPMRTLVSQSLLLNTIASDAIDQYLQLNLDHDIPPSHLSLASETQPFGPATFMYTVPPSADFDRAVTLAAAQVRTLADYLREYDISVRFVTIPHFPAAFYSTYSGTEWSSQVGEYDLFAPEAALTAAVAAEGIPVLPMGETLRAQGVSVEDIQAMFFASGTGFLTERGHAVFAEAVYNAFYNTPAP